MSYIPQSSRCHRALVFDSVEQRLPETFVPVSTHCLLCGRYCFKTLKGGIKALLGTLARLSWGRRNMIGSMDGRQGRVYIEYVKG